ncbi:MAG: glycine oxidase ThiO [Myxococcota bacterium]
MTAADVLVVGGGVMGCATALRLAEAGARTVVLERSVPGAEASSAAAGILGAAIEAHHGGPSLALGRRSRELHDRLAEQLLSDHGIDVGLRGCGLMLVAFDDEERAHLDETARVWSDAGVRAERLDGDGARAREPALAPEVRGAVDLPDEGQVEPAKLLKGLAIAAERAGATFRSGAHVHRVRVEGGRAVGVELDDGLLPAGHVVVAAGSWTGLVGGIPLPKTTIQPVKGQIVACETRPPVFRRIVFGAGGYVVPRPDGRVLCGSTEERVGFRREVTLAGMARVTSIACRLAPQLAEAPVRGHWASFRPGTPDDLPLVGRAGVDGLWLASGHYRNGILLAPVTAEIITGLILGRESPSEVAALDPMRFATGTGAGGAP